MPSLSYETVGDPGQPTIMLLHGFMSSNAQWLLNTGPLSQRFHLVLVELWGHGDSPETRAPADYSIARYLAEFETLRSALNISQWHLIGQSYGAGIVLNYALSHPDVTGKVMVTNSRSAFGDISATAKGNQRQSRRPDHVRDLPLHPINARRFPAHVKQALVRSADQMSMTTIELSGSLASELQFSDKLNALEKQVMLANGKYEKAFQPEVQRLRKRHPALSITDLEGGHSINIEDPNGFNEAAMAFFETD